MQVFLGTNRFKNVLNRDLSMIVQQIQRFWVYSMCSETQYADSAKTTHVGKKEMKKIEKIG